MKRIGILGTGIVGQTIGTKLLQLGYEVMMGSGTADNLKAKAWVETRGEKSSHGVFSDAAAFGDIIFNCTKGSFSLAIIQAIPASHLKGKILVDVSNPLDFSKGSLPVLLEEFCNNYSLGEALQDLLPETNVVKTLNMVNCAVMVDPVKAGSDASMFVSGNSSYARQEVSSILNQFGWRDIIDLQGIQHARGLEMMLPIWLSLNVPFKGQHIAFKIERVSSS